MADGTRTHDNRNHNPGLYQLSYSHRRAHGRIVHARNHLACPTGIEPITPSLEGWCSIRLSYGQVPGPACCPRGVVTCHLLLPASCRMALADQTRLGRACWSG